MVPKIWGPVPPKTPPTVPKMLLRKNTEPPVVSLVARANKLFMAISFCPGGIHAIPEQYSQACDCEFGNTRSDSEKLARAVKRKRQGPIPSLRRYHDEKSNIRRK